MIIRFNLELRDSQYTSYYNQKLTVLEQVAKLEQFQIKPMWKYNKLSNKFTMHIPLKNWIKLKPIGQS